MSISYIIRETLIMMCFAFAIGIAFAYILKTLTFLFSCSGSDIATAFRRGRAIERSSRIYVRKFRRENRDKSGYEPHDTPEIQNVRAMNALAEYHFGSDKNQVSRDKEMNRYYAFKHGKI